MRPEKMETFILHSRMAGQQATLPVPSIISVMSAWYFSFNSGFGK